MPGKVNGRRPLKNSVVDSVYVTGASDSVCSSNVMLSITTVTHNRNTLFSFDSSRFVEMVPCKRRQLRLLDTRKRTSAESVTQLRTSTGGLYFHRVHELNNYATGIYEYFTNYCRRLIVRSCRGKHKRFITHELTPVTVLHG